MKKEKRIVQAIVVIIVVGIGWVHNLDKKSMLYEQFSPVSVSLENNNGKSDTLEVKENKIYIFTRNIIETSIQHLISTL